jgi:hypothetical protein
MQPQRFRKKPVEVEAVRWNDETTVDDLKRFGARLDPVPVAHDGSTSIWNDKEGCWVRCPPGHWVIKGVADEFYPCDPDVFAATYEPVDA